MRGEIGRLGKRDHVESRVTVRAYLCSITLYVLFWRYITAVLFSAYSRSGSVLPCVIRCEITAVITAYTLLATLTDALIKIKTKRINEAKDDLKKAERLLQDSNRHALQKHKRAGIDARKAERERLKMIKELQQANSNSDGVIDLQFFPPIRDPMKEPTPQELEDLLPNPSLQQGVDQAKQRLAELDEQELPVFTELQIDPQILADEKARYPRTYILGDASMLEQEETQAEEEEGEDITILGLGLIGRVDNGGHAGLDWEDTRSVVSDDSMNADFISFNT